MKYGVVITGGDAQEIVDTAVLIEEHGWDAAFGWETVYGLDPWVLFGAMAARTSRIMIGPLLTPPSRRRPWKLAAEVATLDRLSNGRAVLIVGLGATMTGFSEVGEATDRKTRAELLDESLVLMDRFWSGEPFEYSGKHFQVDWTAMPNWALKPIQQPRVPIWTVAMWPSERSMSRAFRVDGCLPFVRCESEMENAITPENIAAIRSEAETRKPGENFDIVIEGVTPPGDEQAENRVRAFEAAGATWWVESMWEHPGGMAAVHERIKAGPPQR